MGSPFQGCKMEPCIIAKQCYVMSQAATLIKPLWLLAAVAPLLSKVAKLLQLPPSRLCRCNPPHLLSKKPIQNPSAASRISKYQLGWEHTRNAPSVSKQFRVFQEQKFGEHLDPRWQRHQSRDPEGTPTPEIRAIPPVGPKPEMPRQTDGAALFITYESISRIIADPISCPLLLMPTFGQP